MFLHAMTLRMNNAPGAQITAEHGYAHSAGQVRQAFSRPLCFLKFSTFLISWMHNVVLLPGSYQGVQLYDTGTVSSSVNLVQLSVEPELIAHPLPAEFTSFSS
jgi:hypothetical protein